MSGMRDDCPGNEDGERHLRGLYVRDDGELKLKNGSPGIRAGLPLFLFGYWTKILYVRAT
jgi:hypothetical protein